MGLFAYVDSFDFSAPAALCIFNDGSWFCLVDGALLEQTPKLDMAGKKRMVVNLYFHHHEHSFPSGCMERLLQSFQDTNLRRIVGLGDDVA